MASHLRYSSVFVIAGALAKYGQNIKGFLTQDVASFSQESHTESPLFITKRQSKIRQSLIRKYSLKKVTQEQFDNLPMEKGFKVCQRGYDYSGIDLGKTPCVFEDGDGFAFLGHNQEWPQGSIFNKNLIFGESSIIGFGSTVVDCKAMDGSSTSPNCRLKNTTFGDYTKLGAGTTCYGGITIGDHSMADIDVTFENSKLGNRIGHHFKGSTGFTIKASSSIGENAKFGHNTNINDTEIGSGLDMQGNSVLRGCYIKGVKESGEAYFLKGVTITGDDQRKCTLESGGFLDGCEVKNAVNVVGSLEIKNSTVDSIPHIHKGSSIINSSVRGAVVIDELCQITNSTITNATIERATIVDSEIAESVIGNSTISGSNSRVHQSLLMGKNLVCNEAFLSYGCRFDGVLQYKNTTVMDRNVPLANDKMSEVKIQSCKLSSFDGKQWFCQNKTTISNMKNDDISTFVVEDVAHLKFSGKNKPAVNIDSTSWQEHLKDGTVDFNRLILGESEPDVNTQQQESSLLQTVQATEKNQEPSSLQTDHPPEQNQVPLAIYEEEEGMFVDQQDLPPPGI